MGDLAVDSPTLPTARIAGRQRPLPLRSISGRRAQRAVRCGGKPPIGWEAMRWIGAGCWRKFGHCS